MIASELSPTLSVVLAALPTLAAAVMAYLLILVKAQIAKHQASFTVMAKQLDATAKQVDDTSAAVSDTQTKMASLEKHTNSMKDALVNVTRDSAYARGVLEGQQNPVAPPNPVTKA